MRWTAFSIVALFFLGLAFSHCGGNSNVIDTVACPIAPAVNKIAIADDYYNRKVQLKTRVFYRANEVHRAWLKKNRPDKTFGAFAKEVKESHRYGFNPKDYHITELETAVEELFDNRERTNADISSLDIRITASFFLFTTHLIEGRIRSKGVRPFTWERITPLENDIALLLKMESVSDLKKELAGLHPNDPQYDKLQKALEDYRKLSEADSLPPIPTTVNVRPGDTHKSIPSIRAKLNLIGYKVKTADDSELHDEDLTAAVKSFQLRHGLEPDGVIDPETARLINIPLARKAALISLNLERLRWRPHLRGEGDEIVINVPEYMLRVYRNNREKMRMRVVLGAEYTPTPVFHDTLQYIVFSPTWMVPRSIFENEFYPKLREQADDVSWQRFRFFKDGKEIDPTEEDWTDKKLDISSYSVVEKPGDANALGNVKFIMPNNFSIYLHDTPADKLFREESRALSHGCIRLEKPMDFAEYLLADKKGWDAEKIEEAMKSGEPLEVDLEKPYPVYIVYRTVWVDESDEIHFREDIYGHDERHLALLE